MKQAGAELLRQDPTGKPASGSKGVGLIFQFLSEAKKIWG